MNNKKESAIQWMSEALQALDETIKQAPKTVNYLATRENIVKKAEKMFAEQIIDACNLQRNDYKGMPTYNKSGEQYYNETYGGCEQ